MELSKLITLIEILQIFNILSSLMATMKNDVLSVLITTEFDYQGTFFRKYT